MSMFKVGVVAANPKDEQKTTLPIDSIVDTGSELTWLPGDALAQIGIAPRRERSVQTATGQIVKRQTGYAILRAEGFETSLSCAGRRKFYEFFAASLRNSRCLL